MSDRPFVFAVDLDGVCADYYSGLADFVAQRRGLDRASLTVPDDYSSFESWGLTFDEFKQLHAEAVDDGLFTRLKVIDGAPETLWRLSDEGVHIRIITHRLHKHGQHHRVAADTTLWLNRGPDGSGDGHMIDGVKRDWLLPTRDLCFMGLKSDVGADVYIDDAPSNVTALRDAPPLWSVGSAGRTVIVMDQPYNRHMDGPRAANWDDVYRIVSDVRARSVSS